MIYAYFFMVRKRLKQTDEKYKIIIDELKNLENQILLFSKNFRHEIINVRLFPPNQIFVLGGIWTFSRFLVLCVEFGQFAW